VREPIRNRAAARDERAIECPLGGQLRPGGVVTIVRVAGGDAHVESATANTVEALLEERVDQLARLSALSTATARAASLEDAYEAALDCVADTLSPDRASVLLFDARGVMRWRAWRGLSAEYRQATEGHSPWTPQTPDPEPVLVPDVAAEPSLAELRPAIEREGIRSLGFFPLMDRGRLLGKFMVYFDEPHVFTPIEVRLAQAIGAHVSLEIARGQREAQTRFVIEASQALGRSLDFRATLRQLAELSVPFLADACAIHVAGPNGLRLVALANDDATDAGRITALGAAAARAVVESGEPTLYDDDADGPARSVMIVPLRAHGRTLGAISFVATGGHRRYGDADLDFAADLARRAALAADNGLLHEAEQRARHTAERLQDVSEALAGTLTVEEVVEVLVREGSRALGAAAGWLGELDEEARELRRLGAIGYDPQLDEAYSRLPVDLDNPTVHAALENRALWFASAAEVASAYPSLAKDYAASGSEAMAVVPLVVAGRSTGVIALTFRERRTFREDERRLLAGLAAQCGQALERARLYAELQERADAASALAHVEDGVFQLDEDDRVTLWNRGAAVITGIDANDALRRPIGELIGDWDQIKGRINVTDVPRAVGRRDAVPAQVGDRELWLVISGVVAGDSVVYAFRDVTESEHLEKARRDFLATASHELRTPLAGVFGATKTLLHRDLDDESRKALLEVIDTQTGRLARILDELLFASRLDAGKMDLELQGCALGPLVEEVANLERPRLPASISLVVDTSVEVPNVRCDPHRLRQALLNLLDNAIKYSPDGGTIAVSVRPTDDAVRVSVADEGLGIPPAERDRVFEKFYRLDPGLTRGVGGTGLGLYISRQSIEQMNGRVWVDPGDGPGTTFHVELPLALDA
jgi:signal transduction histidine kinase